MNLRNGHGIEQRRDDPCARREPVEPDIRDFLASRGVDELAELFAVLTAPAPFVVAIAPAVAFDALSEASERVASSKQQTLDEFRQAKSDLVEARRNYDDVKVTCS